VLLKLHRATACTVKKAGLVSEGVAYGLEEIELSSLLHCE
jgi:hypothetical protein